MHENGIPTVVWLGPILPFINDTEENLRGILNYCIEAKVYGIICFGMGLTLREGNREYYYKKLDEHFPGLKSRYIQKYGNSYNVPSDNNKKLMKIFKEVCEQNKIVSDAGKVFSYLREYTDKNEIEQISMFDWGFTRVKEIDKRGILCVQELR